MIKAVIFDGDGMVINGKLFSKQLAEEGIVGEDKTAPFLTGIFQECMSGKVDLKEILPGYLKEWGLICSVDEFLADWFKRENHVDQRIIEKVKLLREKGIQCFLAMNQEKYRTRFIEEEMKLGDAFSKMFISCKVGVRKPLPEFLGRIQEELHRLGITKDEVLLWDDQEKNVKAAKEFGWQAELYTSFENFEQKTNRYLFSKTL